MHIQLGHFQRFKRCIGDVIGACSACCIIVCKVHGRLSFLAVSRDARLRWLAANRRAWRSRLASRLRSCSQQSERPATAMAAPQRRLRRPAGAATPPTSSHSTSAPRRVLLCKAVSRCQSCTADLHTQLSKVAQSSLSPRLLPQFLLTTTACTGRASIASFCKRC